MSHSYHANQYESGYNSTRVKNWEITKDQEFTSRIPEAHEGSTQFLADNRGYLLPKAPRSEKTPWGSFMGTWELPARLPPADINPTARRPEAAQKLRDLIENSSIRQSNISHLPDSQRKGRARESSQSECPQTRHAERGERVRAYTLTHSLTFTHSHTDRVRDTNKRVTQIDRHTDR
uniref:Protein Flattop n=1 Tax=Callorhinchus milii TaxID=7868 RepID=A0A4W3GC38_CALMI